MGWGLAFGDRAAESGDQLLQGEFVGVFHCGRTIAPKRLALKKYFADFCKSRDSMRLSVKYFSVDTEKQC